MNKDTIASSIAGAITRLVICLIESLFIWIAWPFVMIPIFGLPAIGFGQTMLLLLIVDTLVHSSGASNKETK